MSNRIFIAAGAFWLAAVLGAFGMLNTYAFTPAPLAEGVPQWPPGSALAPSNDAATLLVFVHPKCPCTRATLAEIDRLLPHVAGRITPIVVAVEPDGAGDWRSAANVRYFENHPLVRTVFDRGGAEARAFGATTSGETFLYAAGGRLLFQGGVTAGRGHEGDNAAKDALRAAIERPGQAVLRRPAFGCGLLDSGPAAG